MESEKFIEWCEDNIEVIIEKYQDAFPEVIRNNADPSDYLDFDYVYEWAHAHLYEEVTVND